MKYSKDGLVTFNKEHHTYRLGDKYLQSITGLISKFKNPFDSEKIATAYALKHGLDKNELLIKWENEGKISRDHGTAVHGVFENYIINNEIVLTGEWDKENVAEKFINEVFKTERLIPVETELIVYNDSIATQVDCIAKNKEGDHFILDWKTNKKIETCGYGKFMLPPFELYPDASFYHYSLQLTLNKILCKEYDIKKAFIVHILDDDYNFIEAEQITIPESILNYSL